MNSFSLLISRMITVYREICEFLDFDTLSTISNAFSFYLSFPYNITKLNEFRLLSFWEESLTPIFLLDRIIKIIFTHDLQANLLFYQALCKARLRLILRPQLVHSFGLQRFLNLIT